MNFFVILLWQHILYLFMLFLVQGGKLTGYSSPLSTGVVYSRLEERGYHMLCLCICSSWGWACQGPKYVEDSNVTYMLLLNCALKLVEEIILYYEARSKKHQITFFKSISLDLSNYLFEVYRTQNLHYLDQKRAKPDETTKHYLTRP